MSNPTGINQYTGDGSDGDRERPVSGRKLTKAEKRSAAVDSHSAKQATDHADKEDTVASHQAAFIAHDKAFQSSRDVGHNDLAKFHEDMSNRHIDRVAALRKTRHAEENVMAQDLRSFHLRLASYAARTSSWQGRPHLVVPVIALREGVIHAVNADVPEYVSAEALTKAAESWNGRSLVVGHPVRGGRQCSADESGVYDERGFGFIRESQVKGKNLSMEAWVDTARLEVLGHHEFLSQLRAGKQIEVSVGAHVRTLNKKGTHNGKPYQAEWGEIVGDHLAFLPAGRGACSIEMGCGAHRAASAVLKEKMPVDKRLKKLADMVKGLGGKLKAAALYDTPEQQASEEQAELITYSTMRQLMDTAVLSTTSASDLIDELIAAEEDDDVEAPTDEQTETEVEGAQLEAIVAFCGNAAQALMSIQTCCYKAMSNSARPVAVPTAYADNPQRYMEQRALIGKTISRATMKTIQAMHDHSHEAHDHAMGLGTECNSGDMKAAERNPSSEDIMTKDTRNALIKTLAACECSGFKDDTASLEALSDVRLEALSAATTARETQQTELSTLRAAQATLQSDFDALKTSNAELKTASAQPKQLTVDEFMSVAPAELKTLIESKRADDAAATEKLVIQLKTAQSAYTEDELKTLSLPVLRKLAAVAKIDQPVADFSGMGQPRVLTQPKDLTVPPDPYAADIKALQASTKH